MLDNLTLTLIGIIVLFFIFLAFKTFLKNKKFCVLCISVSSAWIILLVLYYFSIFSDKTILAILMGHTSLGLFYLFYDKLGIFKLPFLLTTISIIYFVLEGFLINGFYILLAVWILFFIFNLFKNKKFAKKIIECCRKW